MNTKTSPRKIFLTKKVEVDIDLITFIEGDINYSKVFFFNGSFIVLSTTLKKLEIILEEHNFIRIHKKYLLNLAYLKRDFICINPIQLPNNKNVKVSRRKQFLLFNY